MDNCPPVGSIGRALGKLAPSGPVEVLGTTYAARTEGETIDADRIILVTGFEPWGLLVREATPAEMAPAPLSSLPPAQVSGSRIGNFFLYVGAVICLVACAFTVAKTLFELWTLTQVFPLITLSPEASVPMLVMLILLSGFVEFSFFAALLVTFLRVLGLK